MIIQIENGKISILFFQEICNRPFITDDMDLEITCLQTFVVMRKMFCEWESCPALPKVSTDCLLHFVSL